MTTLDVMGWIKAAGSMQLAEMLEIITAEIEVRSTRARLRRGQTPKPAIPPFALRPPETSA